MRLFESMLQYELKVLLRSKWLLSFTLLFIGLAFLLYFYGMQSSSTSYSAKEADISGVTIKFMGESNLSYFGLEAKSEQLDSAAQAANGYNRSISMLINLSLWILPLICLLLGTNSIVADKEEGRYRLYQTYKMTSILYLASKYVALVLSLTLSLGIAYGLFGMYLYFTDSFMSADLFATFLVLNIFLVIVFASFAVLVGALSSKRMQGLSYALLLWSFLLFVYEFILFSVLNLVPYAQKLVSLLFMVLANPIESVRIWTINQLGANYIFGPEFLILNEWGSSNLLTLYLLTSLFIIVVMTLGLSTIILRKR